MRSRLQRGLITEISALDRGAAAARSWSSASQEKRATDPSFELSGDVVELLADRLTESGRELEGRRQPPLPDLAADARARHARHRRDHHPRSRAGHRAAPHQDRGHPAHRLAALCRVQGRTSCRERRHRSVVRPRQIGMYLAKQLTSRSLPEIGRRFGNRDHTTVLHAIRKIDREVGEQSAPQGRDRGAEAPAQPLARRDVTVNSVRRGVTGRRIGSGAGSGVVRRRSLLLVDGARSARKIVRPAALAKRRSRSTLARRRISQPFRGFRCFRGDFGVAHSASSAPRQARQRDRERLGHEAGDRTR